MRYPRPGMITLFLYLVLQIERGACQPGIGQRFLTSYQNQNSTHRKEARRDDNTRRCRGSSSLKNDDTSVSTSDFFALFQKLGTSWHTILHMFRGIVNSAGGETFHKDVHVDTLKEGREWLYQENDWKQILKAHTTLYEDLDVTIDDLLDSFLHWASADEAPDGKCHLQGGLNGKETKINASKAQRRLEKYEAWMVNLEEDLKDLTAVSLKNTFSIFDMKLSIDGCQRLAWWLDLAAIDWDAFEDLEPRDIARVFVWMSHYMLLHPNAQHNGLVFVNSLNQIGFWSFMTMLPVDLGMQLDEFTISVIPIKTKFVVVMERPPWAKFAYQLLKPFLQSDMRRRVVVIEEGQYPPSYLYEVVGRDAIPEGVQNYAGSKHADIIHPYMQEKQHSWSHYLSFSSKKRRQQ
jgi:hypothetical protein